MHDTVPVKTDSARTRQLAAYKRPTGRLIILAILFFIAISYHVRVSMYREPAWFGQHPVVRPFFVGGGAIINHVLYPRITFLIDRADQAGLKANDILLSVNGRAITGSVVAGEELRKAKDGDWMTVTIARREAVTEKSNGAEDIEILEKGSPSASGKLQLPLVKRTYKFQLYSIGNFILINRTAQDILLIALPMVSLLIGFWVAAVRPQDPLAWLVLALMMAFLTFGDPNVPVWPKYLRDLGMAFRQINGSLFATWLLLFGIYFPGPFPETSRWHAWVKWKWVLIVPLAIFAVTDLIESVGYLENFKSVQPLLLKPAFLSNLNIWLSYIASGLGCTMISMKYKHATQDAQRRLRLLAVGLTLSFGPFSLVRAYSSLRHINSEIDLPKAVWFTADVLFFLFPILLAYVIVVHRAMDVRFVLRQGLQYALARNGVRVIQFAITAIALFAAVRLISNSGSNPWLKLIVLTAGIVLIPLIQNGADRLRKWVDARFFREAYNAENVLNELSDQVRSMVQPQSLLETVVTRISETLHVPKIAVLLDSGSPFRPVYAVGYGAVPQLQFASSSGSVKLLRTEKEPLRVYPDDETSWLYREETVTPQERDELAKLNSELLLPLSSRDKLLGFISLGPKRSEEPFTGSDLRLLKSVAAQTGLALENAQLMTAITEEITQRERLNREVEIAREVQERLFPQELPPIAGLDYFGACRPALGVGGDYYDFLALPEGQLGIALGDVSGKGIGAALLMASLQASLRSEAARAPEEIAPIVANVNRLVYQASTSNRYATFFYAQYNPAQRELTYVNAGHNPPMLFRKSGETWQVLRLTAGGTVVGLLESFPYTQEKLAILPGDLLIIFTDGISEAMNPEDDEWGEERFSEAVKACSQLTARDILNQLMHDADAFAAGAKQHDDMTLVVIKVQPS